MGLYDKPHPQQQPQPPSDDINANNKNDDDDEDASLPYQVQRMFHFNLDGSEVRGLLPRLSRSLDSGIGCYFEQSDRLVQNLVQKTECHPEDAAWALEACKGDITEAWTQISVARRQLLEANDDGRGKTLPTEVSELMAENEFETQKEERLNQERMEKQKEYFRPSSAEWDQDWLPVKNPRPIDDEPWFTG
eukprot:scaffold1976_cov86-Cylindrotheca_fusiformis.AAC.3